MKKIIYGILVLCTVGLLSFKTTNDNDIRVTGNILLNSVKALGDDNCSDLEKSEIYLLAYQELYKKHKMILKDNSEALILTRKKFYKQKCTPSNILEGFSITRKVTVGGHGSGITKGKEIPSYILATYYMNPDALESFLSQLNEEVRSEYFKLKKEMNNDFSEIEKNIENETNQIKTLDKRNYLNWYFQNNQKTLKKLKIEKQEELKLDLKSKTIQFQQN